MGGRAPCHPRLVRVNHHLGLIRILDHGSHLSHKVRYLAIITMVKSLADKKVFGNMAIGIGKIVTHSRRLDLDNAMINVLCLDPLKEEYYLLLYIIVIIPMHSKCGLDVVLLHM